MIFEIVNFNGFVHEFTLFVIHELIKVIEYLNVCRVS